jgi:hypothetical protein
MTATDERRVRAVDERPLCLVDCATRFAWSWAQWRRGSLVWMTALDVFRTVGDAFSHEDSNFVRRDVFDRSVDSEATPRCELDRKDADVAPDGDAAQHGIVGRRSEQRWQNAHALAIGASYKAGDPAPYRCPQVSVVSGDRQPQEALPRQKRQRARDNPGRDAGTVPERDVTLAGALLHGDFSLMKWFGAHVVAPLSGLIQNVRMV